MSVYVIFIICSDFEIKDNNVIVYKIPIGISFNCIMESRGVSIINIHNQFLYYINIIAFKKKL